MVFNSCLFLLLPAAVKDLVILLSVTHAQLKMDPSDCPLLPHIHTSLNSTYTTKLCLCLCVFIHTMTYCASLYVPLHSYCMLQCCVNCFWSWALCQCLCYGSVFCVVEWLTLLSMRLLLDINSLSMRFSGFTLTNTDSSMDLTIVSYQWWEVYMTEHSQIHCKSSLFAFHIVIKKTHLSTYLGGN